MLYCNKCARILEEDLQFCPICNEEDPDWQARQDFTEPDLISQDFISQDLIDHDVSNQAFKGEVFDRLREINKHVEERAADKQEQDDFYMYQNKDQPSVGLYAALILISICFSFIGLIVGIVFMTNKNKSYRTMGLVTLAVSVTFMVIGFLFIFLIIMLGMTM